MKAYVLLLTTLLAAACGDTLDAASQATWWKTKEAMCGREMREWSKYADRRNKIVDRITQECYAERTEIEREFRAIDIERTACFDKTPDWRTYN